MAYGGIAISTMRGSGLGTKASWSVMSLCESGAGGGTAIMPTRASGDSVTLLEDLQRHKVRA